MKLYTKILIGMAAGIVVGLVYNQFGLTEWAQYTKWIGDIFIRLVKMLVVPLVLVSLTLGAAGLGDIRKLGKMGLKAFLFFMATTAIASSIGIGVANLVEPGTGLPEEQKEMLLSQYSADAEAKTNTEGAEKMRNMSEFEKIVALFVNMVPTNPIQALATGDMLGVIFFSLFLGICITLIAKEKADPLIKAFDGTQ